MAGTHLHRLLTFTRVIGGCSVMLIVVGLSGAYAGIADESVAGVEVGLAFAVTGGALGLIALFAFALTLHACAIAEAMNAAPPNSDHDSQALARSPE